MSSRIALDYTPAYEQGAGIGRLVRDLVNALASIDTDSQYRLFISGVRGSSLPIKPGANFSWSPSRISPKWFARIWHRMQIPLPIQTFTGQVDLYHATDFVLPPVFPKIPTIVTVHDLSFIRVPEAASPRLRAYLDVVVPRSAKKASHIIADSEATKRDLIELYDLATEKISVVLSGVDPRFRPTGADNAILDKYRIKRPFIFSVGTVQPRKNYGRLVEAFAQVRAKNYDLDLVIAGGKGWLENPIFETIKRLNLVDYVHFLGFVDDANLPMLYSTAECVAYPSLYEGFGFPILEGMACGSPVITSNVSSLPEVAGDAAIMVDPYNVEALAVAIIRVLDDSILKQTMIQKGYEQAKGFTWVNSAQQLYKVYQQVLKM